ncbi:MAG: redoxin domain-containing protein [Bacteroidetes bacterium]|nr:redoxin domain-containing protein [Balneolaceae bacterium]MBL6916846.1 redoxin domain-containing protein [Balneolaceae bacterium]MDA0737199.1 redoxin domain-containing protein [Bacteroidota bacterium]MDA1125518.1 redoxin domain-containing protein [Bacteroidota bacterium]
MISVGEQINTNFTVKAVHEGQEQEVLFSELLTNPTIVSVYMKNNTGSCDKQTASLAEHASWFADKGYQLMALSKDTCGSHKKYADKQGISFTLLSDPDHAFANATQSMVEKKMYGKVYEAPSRSAFVIDTDGTILAVIEKVNTKAHAEELKELVESL